MKNNYIKKQNLIYFFFIIIIFFENNYFILLLLIEYTFVVFYFKSIHYIKYICEISVFFLLFILNEESF